MTLNTFREPIRILVGLGFPREIRSPLDALVYLNDVPGALRNSAHSVVVKACKAALLGEIEPETARGAFLAYAQRQDIFAPDVDDVLASSATRHCDPHTS